MMYRFALLTLGVCQAWQHFLSFNDKCTAELSAFRGTKLETSLTGGRLPYQFKYAMEQVIKSRVASEGCTVNAAQQDLLFGMNFGNVLRFLDSSDNTLASASLPPSCNATLDFNWKKAKEDFDGFVLPSSCTAKGYAANKLCQAKFKLLENMYIELRIEEVCNSDSQNGYGLPTINVFCSGSLCDSFVKPCSSNADCSGGATCDTVEGSALVDALQPLIDIGLFNDTTDASCSGSASGTSFQEKFWSGVMNSAAYLVGLTTTPSTAVYSEVKLCGIGPLQTKYIPTERPTPAPTFQCYTNEILPLSQVCDGTPQCQNGEDERYCRCGVGRIDNGQTFSDNHTECCDVCQRNYLGYYCPSQFCGSNSYYGGSSSFNFDAACSPAQDGEPISCPTVLFESNTALPQFTKKALSSVSPASASQHIVGWADCNGNLQIGSPAELVVFNTHVPFQEILGEAERIAKSLETCRAGTAAAGGAWARQFFPWAVSFWGGIFFSDAASQNIFNNINPAALVDNALRYYDSAQERNYTYNPVYGYSTSQYIKSAPFANVENAPTSCNLASTTGSSASCGLTADIGSWFAGDSFPAGWDGATAVKLNVASTCTTSSLPTAFMTCEGACDANSKSGCCILRNVFTSQNVPGRCPPGYQLVSMNSGGVTDFLVNSKATTHDTTLQNFVQLVTARSIKFGAGGAVFVDPTGNADSRSFCIINGSHFDDNTEQWAKTAVTEDCTGTPGQQGCPRFLGAGVTGCSGASCVAPPAATSCNPQCPNTPTTGTGGGGTTANPASLAAPIFGLVASLGVAALF